MGDEATQYTTKRDFLRLEEAFDQKFGVFIEHIDSKFEIVFEAFQTMDVRMDRLEKRLVALEERVSALEIKTEFMLDELKNIRAELEAKTNRKDIARLEVRVTKLEKEVAARERAA